MNKVKAIIQLFRLDESMITVPFAAWAAFLVSDGVPDLFRLFLVIMAVFAGYSAGNALNGFADRDIDANNPRTKDRPVAKGVLRGREIAVIIAICVIVALVCVYLLNPYYLLLLPFLFAVCAIYCVCKRFTWLGHFVIAFLHAVCPVAGWIVFSSWTDFRYILVGAVVFFWTISLDMLYSSQDIEYDLKEGTYSLPALIGEKAAFVLSIVFHIIMLLLYVWLMFVTGVGICFTIATVIGEIFLIMSYVLIIINKENGKYAMRINQVFCVLILLGAILDKILL